MLRMFLLFTYWNIPVPPFCFSCHVSSVWFTGFLTDDLVNQDEGAQKKYLGVCQLPGENRKVRHGHSWRTVFVFPGPIMSEIAVMISCRRLICLHTCQLSVFWTESPSFFSSHRNLRPPRLKSPSCEHRRFFLNSVFYFFFRGPTTNDDQLQAAQLSPIVSIYVNPAWFLPNFNHSILQCCHCVMSEVFHVVFPHELSLLSHPLPGRTRRLWLCSQRSSL